MNIPPKTSFLLACLALCLALSCRSQSNIIDADASAHDGATDTSDVDDGATRGDSDGGGGSLCKDSKNPLPADDTIYVGNNEKLYLSTSLDFVSHENCTGAIATINRAFPDNGDNTKAVTVFYEVSGNGINEVSIASGTATIPANKNYVDIPIDPINSPSSSSEARTLTITLTPKEGYRIANDIEISKGEVTIAVRDDKPVKAFPLAFGGGAYAKGGRGGNVYHVTRLDDVVNGGVPEEGTFRWAIEQPRPATIVFDVAGTIVLANSLREQANDLTIAGQTAPFPGITLTTDGGKGSNNDYKTIAFTHMDDFIMRYMKIRHQITNAGLLLYANRDTGRNFIVDHCSFSWAGNSSITVRGNLGSNSTLQRSILAESKVGSLYGDSQQHEWSFNHSIHQNLWYNISHRVPNSGANGRVDNVNNVIQNWTFRLSFINGDNRYNHLNNYYAMGDKTAIESNGRYFVNQLVSEETKYEDGPDPYETTPYDYEVFTSGNIIDKGVHGLNDDNKRLWAEFDAGDQAKLAPSSVFVDAQHPLLGAPLPVQSASDFYQEVITDFNVGSNASLNADGSVRRESDNIDLEYFAVLAAGEGSAESYNTAEEPEDRNHYMRPRYLNFVASISTTPLNIRPADFYGSNPHIPGVWFQANVPSGEDHNDLAPSGYTWLEEYLSQVDQ